MMNIPVKAIVGGTVIRAWADDGKSPYGNRITIRHADGTAAMYAHLETMLVKEGQLVRQAFDIGIMGKTGTGDKHLHLSYFLRSVKDYTSAYASDPYPFVASNIMPCNTFACNPFGSKACSKLLKYHEGIDFSGQDANYLGDGIIRGLVVNAAYIVNMPT